MANYNRVNTAIKNNNPIVERTGRVNQIMYQDISTGYVIAYLDDTERGNCVILGVVPNLKNGDYLSVTGHFSTDKKYHSKNIQILSYNYALPTTKKGIEKYLVELNIKGLGIYSAEIIVKAFGLKTFNVIDKEPERLYQVPRLKHRVLDELINQWSEKKEFRDISSFLLSYGIGPSYIMRIYKEYGSDTIDIVSKNPYCLAKDIKGIGFLKADAVAKNMGIPIDSPQRIEEGIFFALNNISKKGHVFLPYDKLITESRNLLMVKSSLVEQGISSLSDNGRIVFDKEQRVYTSWLYQAETGLAKYITELNLYYKPRGGYIYEEILEVERALNINLAEKQKEAVMAARNNKVMVITGGPGTGKTTIIKSVIELYKKEDKHIVLAAPTGRAAKRMMEATGMQAKTIHRLLEYSNDGFGKNFDNKIHADILIIDEASMIDLSLMYHLLRAIPLRTILILVGDIHQLPSVGAGNVLKNIIDSEAFCVVTLDQIFRQSEESRIIVNAHKINKGEMPKIENSEKDDFFFVPCSDEDKITDTIVDLCTQRLPKKYGLNPLDDIQVLSPMHKGSVGVSILNKKLQKSLNHNKVSVVSGSESYKIGDRVIQIRNNYGKNVFNGDVGIVSGIDHINKEIFVFYDNQKVVYDFSELDDLKLAYAISVHKSQGSEYPVIIMPITMGHHIMLQRNLIYTGITRGKKMVILVGDKKALKKGILNDKTKRRYSILEMRIKEELATCH